MSGKFSYPHPNVIMMLFTETYAWMLPLTLIYNTF